MARFREEWSYIHDWLNTMYAGKPYLGLEDIKAFMTMEREIEKQRGRGINVGLESSSRRGVGPSGITDKWILENVTEPVESAHAKLALERAGIVRGEKKKRWDESVKYGMEALAQDRARGAGIWSTLGKIGGIGAGIGLSFLPGVGPILGRVLSQAATGFDFTNDDWSDIFQQLRDMLGEGEEEDEGGVI